jgi:replicative DNA helicase
MTGELAGVIPNLPESVDGIAYLASLDDGLPLIPNIASYIGIVKEKSARRRIIYGADALQRG